VYLNPAEVEVQYDADGSRRGARSLADHAAVEFGGLGTMSKSKNNGVDPQILVERYGADTARLFMMFASPPEQSLEWSDEGVQGQHRFLRRLWKAVHEHVALGPPPARADARTLSEPARALRRAAHQTLAKVTSDLGRRRTFNTAIASVMELLNAIGHFADAGDAARAVRQEALEIAVLALSPIVPHIAHALWHGLGHERAIIDEPWPQPDAQALEQSMIELIVQVNGKLRGRLQLPAGAGEQSALEAALLEPTVQRFVAGREIRKVVHVPDKLLNLVV
jgi:leucyl-tRNA synthetase